MNHTADPTLTYSSGFSAIETALHAREQCFTQLISEMRGFEPKPESAFEDFREQWAARMREMNPELAEQALREFVDLQVRYAADPGEQLGRRFGARFDAEVIAITVLSHALIEAVINALLALGLAKNGTPDVFPLIERADVRHKWIHGPKAFNREYKFPTGTAVHEALAFLCRQRNALVHYKISLTVGEQPALKGSQLTRLPYEAEAEWMRRFLDLPYDLLGIANAQLGPSLGQALLMKRIPRVQAVVPIPPE